MLYRLYVCAACCSVWVKGASLTVAFIVVAVSVHSCTIKGQREGTLALVQRIYTNLLWILSKCSTTKGYRERPQPLSQHHCIRFQFQFYLHLNLCSTSSISWDTVEIPHGTDVASEDTSVSKDGLFIPQCSCPLSPWRGKKTIKCCTAHCISFPLVFSLRLTVLFTYHFKSSKLAPLHPTTQTGRQSESVPLNLLNIELTSELIHVLPHATQPRPQGLIVLSIHGPRRHVAIVCWVPVCLLDGGVCWHVPDDLNLFRLWLNVLRVVFVYRWAVSVALSCASERNEGLVCLAAVFACYSKAAEAVEISKFLSNGKKIFFSNTNFSYFQENNDALKQMCQDFAV